MKIKYKIIGMFLMSAILPFIVIATLVFLDFKAAIERQAIDSLDLISSIQRNRLTELMDGRKQDIVSIASLSPLVTDLKNYYENPSTESLDKINYILVATRNGVPRFLNIKIVDLNGTVVSSTQDDIGKNFISDESYIKGFDKSSIYDLKKDFNGVVINTLSGPIYDGSQKIGVLIIDVDAKDIFELFNDRTGLKETGDWGLSKKFSDTEGLVIVPSKYETRPDAPLTVTFDLNTNLPAANAVKGFEKIFTDTVDFRGKGVITSTKYLSESGWGLVVKIDKDEVYKPIYDLGQYLIFFMCLIFIFTISVGSLLAGMLAKPLDRLLKSINSIQAGNLNVKTGIKTDDEIGLLSKEFDQMTLKLKDAHDSLEQKVLEKTKALSDKIIDLERLNKVTVDRELKMIELKEQIKKLTKKNE